MLPATADTGGERKNDITDVVWMTNEPPAPYFDVSCQFHQIYTLDIHRAYRSAVKAIDGPSHLL